MSKLSSCRANFYIFQPFSSHTLRLSEERIFLAFTSFSWESPNQFAKKKTCLQCANNLNKSSSIEFSTRRCKKSHHIFPNPALNLPIRKSDSQTRKYETYPRSQDTLTTHTSSLYHNLFLTWIFSNPVTHLTAYSLLTIVRVITTNNASKKEKRTVAKTSPRCCQGYNTTTIN